LYTRFDWLQSDNGGSNQKAAFVLLLPMRVYIRCCYYYWCSCWISNLSAYDSVRLLG